MPNSCELCALVGSLADADALREAGATRIYLDVIDLEPTAELLCAVREADVVPVLDEVCRESDHARIDPWIAAGAPVAVGNLSELSLAAECGALAEVRGCIPVHNTAALQVLEEFGASFVWLSPEPSLAEACELARAASYASASERACDPSPAKAYDADREAMPSLGVVAFGRPRLMTCEHCALQVAYDCDRNHAACPHRARPHWLVNIDGRRLPVRTDARGRSRVYLDEPIDLAPRAAELADAGVSRLLVDATTTSVEEACDALRRLRDALAGSPVSARGCTGLSETGVE